MSADEAAVTDPLAAAISALRRLSPEHPRRAAETVLAALDAALTEQEADRAVIVNLIAENNTLRAARRRARAVPVDAPVYYDANTAHGWEAGRNAVLDALGEAP